MKTALKANPSSNFNLKNESINLINQTSKIQYSDISLNDLEAMRTVQKYVPASRHGIEAICGASCETGAQ
ncbi:hypothetical protein RND59_19010 [Vibrio ruber]|uniref:hypothetical protein n=1 Tax=Vibrio ruber TaxID=184755 RepID=UPI002892DA9A|nr:hypothetical protein [Vibrio ruber]WNJ97295.1 hypothetical protein RND59_19010 [Vibrio ruber]